MLLTNEQKTIMFLKEAINSINRTATILRMQNGNEYLYRINNEPNGTINQNWNPETLRQALSHKDVVIY